MIYGIKNYIKGADLAVAIGIKKERESIRIIGGPTEAIANMTKIYVCLSPGIESSGKLAKKIRAKLVKIASKDLKEEILNQFLGFQGRDPLFFFVPCIKGVHDLVEAIPQSGCLEVDHPGNEGNEKVALQGFVQGSRGVPWNPLASLGDPLEFSPSAFVRFRLSMFPGLGRIPSSPSHASFQAYDGSFKETSLTEEMKKAKGIERCLTAKRYIESILYGKDTIEINIFYPTSPFVSKDFGSSAAAPEARLSQELFRGNSKTKAVGRADGADFCFKKKFGNENWCPRPDSNRHRT